MDRFFTWFATNILAPVFIRVSCKDIRHEIARKLKIKSSTSGQFFYRLTSTLHQLFIRSKQNVFNIANHQQSIRTVIQWSSSFFKLNQIAEGTNLNYLDARFAIYLIYQILVNATLK